MTKKADKLTLGDKTHIQYIHTHSLQHCAPEGADPITLTAGGGAWNLGNFSSDIIAADAVTHSFDIHSVVVSDASANEDYEVVLYYGSGDTEAAIIPFTRTGVQTASFQTECMSVIIPPNSRVRAKLRDGSGGADCNIKIMYHTY